MCQRRLDTGKDSFTGANAALANTRLVVGTTSTGPNLTIAGSVLTNDPDVDTPTGLTAGPALISSANCALCNNVTMEPDGNFIYDPPAGFTGNDTFTYTVNDNDPDTPANLTDTATVTIQVVGPLVWYVDIDATAPASQGGRSHSPFNSLAPLTTGGTADTLDGNGDIIFLDNDDGTVTGYGGGIVLETNQKLWGEPFGLTVDPDGPRTSTTLVAATGTTNPNVFNSAVGGIGITLANGVDIQRVNAGVTGTASNTAGISGTAITTATIGPNQLIQGNATGITLSGAAGGNITVAATISGNSATAVSVSNRTSGTVTVSGDVSGTAGNAAVILTNNTGATIAFTGAINLSGSGAAISKFSASGGGTITANNAANQITGFTGTGITLSGVTIGAAGVTFNTVTSGAPAAVNGILLTNVAVPGSLTVNGGSITATTRALDIDDNSANITIGASLTTSGTAARSVEVTNRDGGIVDINGLVTENSLGITLSTNGTGLVRFDGGINASTGANTAFNATVSGNLAITDTNGATAPNNTLTTTTGTALNVANTTIHADGLTFQSISANGATNGIVLNTTGTSGGLTVTGTGSAGTGGTIQNISTRGASFINAVNISLTGMNFTNANTTDGATSDGIIGGNTDENAALYLQGVTQVDLVNLAINGAVQHGINGNNVTDLDISGTTIQNAGDEVWESSIYIHDLKGVASAGRTNVFSNVNITNDSGQFNIFLQNNDGTNDRPGEKDRLEIINSQFTRNGANFLISDNITVANSGTGNFQVVVSGSTFTAAATCGAPAFAGACVSDNIQVDAGNNAAFDAVITSGNNFTAGNAGQAAVNISASGAGQGTFNVQNVTATVRASTGINVALTTTNSAASLRGTIANNNLSTSVTNNPASGINMVLEGAGTMVVDVNNNTISGNDPTGFDFGIRGGARAGSGTADFQVNNNTAFGEGAGAWFFAGNASAGETSRTCVNFVGNNIDGGATSFADYFVEMYTNTTFQLQGFAGVGTNAAAVAAFIASRDDDAGSVVDAGSGTIVNYSSATCSTP